MIGPTDMQLEESLSGIVSGSWASLGEAPLRNRALWITWALRPLQKKSADPHQEYPLWHPSRANPHNLFGWL